jgi:hypothetical protein
MRPKPAAAASRKSAAQPSGTRSANPGPPQKVHVGDEAGQFRKRARQSDKAFKLAMLAARRQGLENFVLGIEQAPATTHPKFTPAITELPHSASAMADL